MQYIYIYIYTYMYIYIYIYINKKSNIRLRCHKGILVFFRIDFLIYVRLNFELTKLNLELTNSWLTGFTILVQFEVECGIVIYFQDLHRRTVK